MRIHFISIGGSVMHQLALALQAKGYTITGSDDEIFEPSQSNLAAKGLLPHQLGWDANHINTDLDAVILGMHAKADNPELMKAQALGLPIYSFPEYIYQESKAKQRLVIGGSHGKTSTTSMVMHVLKTLQKPFDYLVGARLEGFERSVAVTDAPVIVCEGDEYPASALEKRPKFHFLYPHVAVLTGIAWDHINVFPTFDNYLEQFRIFIARIEPGGSLIYNETDATLVKLVEETRRADISYQPYGPLQHTVNQGITTISIEGYKAALQIFGEHNLLNANAAWLVCKTQGVSAEQFVSAISTFTGAAKRLEVLEKSEKVTVFRDFAHAPSKVAATIKAVRQQFPERKLITVLELHTYSSLSAHFLPEYAHSLAAADAAAVFYSEHALQIKRLPLLEAQAVKEGFAQPDLAVLTSADQLMQWLESQSFDHANLLLMSSGNYDGADLLTFAKTITQG